MVVWDGELGEVRRDGLFGGMIEMFINLIVVLVSQVYTYSKIYQITHFKYVQFIACQLNLNKNSLFYLFHRIIIQRC